MTTTTRPLPAPPATIPMRLPVELRDVEQTATTQGDAVIFRINLPGAALDAIRAAYTAALPGVPLLVVDGATVGVHLIRAASTRRNSA